MYSSRLVRSTLSTLLEWRRIDRGISIGLKCDGDGTVDRTGDSNKENASLYQIYITVHFTWVSLRPWIVIRMFCGVPMVEVTLREELLSEYDDEKDKETPTQGVKLGVLIFTAVHY